MDLMTDIDPPRAAATSIHPTAIVDPKAFVGQGVEIGPFCTIGPDSVVEDGARLVSHVVVDGHTRVGPDVVLFPFCTVGMAPQDLKYKGEPTRTEIGARTQVREHCTIHRGTASGRGLTTVGADCLLMAVAQLPAGYRPIHHSDRGSQYCSHEYVAALNHHGLEVSMTEQNHCYENCHAERVNGILKDEFHLDATFRSLANLNTRDDLARV